MVTDKEKVLDLAQKYIQKGQSKKAIQEYLKLIEADPKDKRLYLKLGDLYFKNRENEKAIKEYLKLADLYTEEDLNSRAISVYKKILSIDPKRIEALNKIAKLYLKEGLKGDARNYYQSILEINPNDQEALKAIGSIEDLRPLKDVSKAASFTETPIPRILQPSESKMIEEDIIGPPSPAIDTTSLPYETEVPSTDKESETHYHLGIAYKEMDLFDYAISEFELASSNPSKKFDCYIMLGNCFMEKGDYNQSIQYYKMASEIKGLSNEELARLHFNLGLAYEANGMISEALKTFNLVLKLDHSFPEAQEKIKELQQLKK